MQPVVQPPGAVAHHGALDRQLLRVRFGLRLKVSEVGVPQSPWDHPWRGQLGGLRLGNVHMLDRNAITQLLIQIDCYSEWSFNGLAIKNMWKLWISTPMISDITLIVGWRPTLMIDPENRWNLNLTVCCDCHLTTACFVVKWNQYVVLTVEIPVFEYLMV